MKYYLLLLMLLLFGVNGNAQHSLKKFPSPKYIEIPFKIVRSTDPLKTVVASYANYTFKLLEGREEGRDNGKVFVYQKGKLIQTVAVNSWINPLAINNAYLLVADINSDHQTDFKVVYYNAKGAGYLDSESSNVFFLARADMRFNIVSFTGFGIDEYDFNKDGKFEVVIQNLNDFKGERYWISDVFAFENDQLVNVSSRYHYPKAETLFEYDDKRVRRIPSNDLIKLSHKLPEDYSVSH